ncbi:hypothetical protein pipiens_014955 [Culex pipiens pipiens]|uniref:Uncharacterized protein n=1 Tax=Culex pipiens pipiens TaxID=38569 RepID=A0ABD1CSH2_CULPP
MKDSLRIDPKVLGERAMDCRPYTKAPYYKEKEFHNIKEKDYTVVESALAMDEKFGIRQARFKNRELCLRHYDVQAERVHRDLQNCHVS